MSMEIQSYDNGYRDITSLVKGDALASELDDVRNTLAHNSTKNLDRAVEESTLRLRNYFGDEVLDASHVVSGIAFSVDTVSDNILNEIVELDENELDFSTFVFKKVHQPGVSAHRQWHCFLQYYQRDTGDSFAISVDDIDTLLISNTSRFVTMQDKKSMSVFRILQEAELRAKAETVSDSYIHATEAEKVLRSSVLCDSIEQKLIEYAAIRRGKQAVIAAGYHEVRYKGLESLAESPDGIHHMGERSTSRENHVKIHAQFQGVRTVDASGMPWLVAARGGDTWYVPVGEVSDVTTVGRKGNA